MSSRGENGYNNIGRQCERGAVEVTTVIVCMCVRVYTRGRKRNKKNKRKKKECGHTEYTRFISHVHAHIHNILLHYTHIDAPAMGDKRRETQAG